MSKDALSAYMNSSMNLRSSRQQELDVLHKINAGLAHAMLDPGKREDFHNALLRNQRMWNIFVVAMAEEDHPYSIELRAELISFGMWVNRHTQKVLREGADIKPLITLNKDLILGMTAKTAPVAEQQPIAPLVAGYKPQGEVA